MAEVRILAPNGMIGTNYPVDSIKVGMSWEPHLLVADAGSTDSGPGDLGSGGCRYPRAAVKRDLNHMLAAARAAKVPMIVGSAGGAGGRGNVDWTVEIIRELAREQGLSFKLAVIYSDQSAEYVKRRLAEGRIRELGGVAPLSEETIDRATNIVGMMGCEPIIEALDNGADVIIAGRSSDTAIFAAYPIWKGVAPGPVWHAAKILECGAAAVEYRPSPDSLFGWIQDDHFEVCAPNADLRCTTVSVAAHALYENGDPYRITEPGGTIDLTGAKYVQRDDRRVAVYGSTFEPAETYTIKLEAAEFVGYQAVAVGGIADPNILSDLPDFLEKTRQRTNDRIERSYGDTDIGEWRIDYRVYGMGLTVEGRAPFSPQGDVGVVIEATAATQETANGLISIARHQLLHQPVPRWKGFISNYGLAYGSGTLVRGKFYRFSMNCVVVPDSPTEMFDIQYQAV